MLQQYLICYVHAKGGGAGKWENHINAQISIEIPLTLLFSLRS